MTLFDLPSGSIITRAQRKERWGGSIQGGIIPSRTSPYVFIYTDPAEGQKYGYNFDGWATDSSVFFYTGEGSFGDQRLTGGNRAILEHRDQGRRLQLFEAVSSRQTGGKLHRYVGEFETDETQPYVRQDGPDASGELRSVVVFRLVAVGAVDRDAAASSSYPDVAGMAQCSTVPTENLNASEFTQPPTEGRTAFKREAELSRRYENYLINQGHTVARCRVRPAGEIAYMLTDIFDVTENELYEVKGVGTRNAVRLAIGQLLDYRRHIEASDAKLAVLLPDRPSYDLIELIHGCGMECVHELESGAFERLAPAT